jgi:hypothetical protein
MRNIYSAVRNLLFVGPGSSSVGRNLFEKGLIFVIGKFLVEKKNHSVRGRNFSATERSFSVNECGLYGKEQRLQSLSGARAMSTYVSAQMSGIELLLPTIELLLPALQGLREQYLLARFLCFEKH